MLFLGSFFGGWVYVVAVYDYGVAAVVEEVLHVLLVVGVWSSGPFGIEAHPINVQPVGVHCMYYIAYFRGARWIAA